MEDKILSFIESNSDEFVALLKALIRIPSLTGEEGEAQLFVGRFLRKLGLDVEMSEPDIEQIFRTFPDVAQYPTHWQHDLILPYDDLPTYEKLLESGKIDVLNYKNRPNLVATLKGKGGGKSLLLNGHIDTVTVEPENLWTHPPFDAEVVEGHIYGRGASDMKGGMVASLCAIKALIGVGATLKGDLLFSSVVNEEHSGNGTLGMVCKGLKPDAAIVNEPSEKNIYIATPGDVYWEVTVEGLPRSPGARWNGDRLIGVSAIEKLPSVIESLLKLEHEYNLKAPDPVYANQNPFSCVMGEIEGGTYATVTANACSVKGCVYFSHGLGSVNQIMQDIKKYIYEGIQSDPWFKDHPIKIVFLHHRNSSKSDPDHPIVDVLRNAERTAQGKYPQVVGAPYGSDMDMLVNQGRIPTVIYGPGSIAYAHKADEKISIEEFISSVKTLALCIYRWCNQ